MKPQTLPQISIVISVFNEEQNIKELYSSLKEILNKFSYEIIFVNDGSTDGSEDEIESIVRKNPLVSGIMFSRNYGHEAAMTAGISFAKGESIICMDADFQHPPSYLPEMIKASKEGAQIVIMQRIHSSEASLLRKFENALFYRLLNFSGRNTIHHNSSDFFLISRRVADHLVKDYGEVSRFTRALIQTLGFRQKLISFTAPNRRFGKTKYSHFSLFNLSSEALIAFSHVPLRLSVVIGLIVGFGSLLVGIFSIIMKYLGLTIPGYTTTVVLISFLFSVQFVLFGILAEYIGVLVSEVKKRPLFIVREILTHEKKR